MGLLFIQGKALMEPQPHQAGIENIFGVNLFLVAFIQVFLDQHLMPALIFIILDQRVQRITQQEETLLME